ncbi:uncharacterized protein [Procambarus clarkii]|uniref:uncharacterized protein isoform X2 n=1 Tax=Procambarus clarkii TaxID=6728 RepID=UPI003742B7BE
MESEDDYSDYEDKTETQSYQLLSSEHDLLRVSDSLSRNERCSQINSISKNSFLVLEAENDCGECYIQSAVDHQSEEEEFHVQDIKQLENIQDHGRMQISMNGTRSSLPDKSSVSSPCTAVTTAGGNSSSRFSRLLFLIKQGKCSPDVNDVNDRLLKRGNYFDQISCIQQNKSNNLDCIRKLSTCNSQENLSTSDFSGVDSSETSSSNRDDAVKYLTSTEHEHTFLMSCDAEATNTTKHLRPPELYSDTLTGKAAESRYPSQKIFSVHLSHESNALQQTFENYLSYTRYSYRRQKPSNNSEIIYNEKSRSTSVKEDSSFKRVKEQLKIFHLRIKVNILAQPLPATSNEEKEWYSRLEIHINELRSAKSQVDLVEKLSVFSSALKSDMYLGNCFLISLMSYAQSVLDLENNLAEICDIIMCLIPCINVVVTKKINKKTINVIKNDNIIQTLYKSMINVFKQETRYTEGSIRELLRHKDDSKIKVHIARMTPQESKKLFQETFADPGNPADMYLIYTWQILNIYEVREDNMQGTSVLSLTQLLEDSGKFINIVPTKDLKSKEGKVPFKNVTKMPALQSSDNLKKNSNSKAMIDLSFEWADFHVGQLYENGVVFLINMTDWLDCLKEISSAIEKLEVKKKVKFLPSLGSTYSLPLQHGICILNGKEDLAYIRVKVVRSAGPVAWVYGIDTGSIHMCEVGDLILLPAAVINYPPCGRLALLPLVPAPCATMVSPSLTLLVVLAQCSDLAEDLCNVNIWSIASLMQVKELTQLTLELLRAIVENIPKTDLLPDVCSVITALCNLGLKTGEQQAFQVVKMLLGGRKAMKKWSSLSRKVSHIHHKRGLHNWKPQRDTVQALSTPSDTDSSPAIICLAVMTSPDRNWDLEVRGTIKSKQLVPYQSHGGWCQDKGQIITTYTGELHYGSMFNVLNDDTHHIILEKSVPNIRMNTLLQIILGMLNTGLGGKIYIGLNQLGIVEGVRTSRNQRDCFMLGFTKLITSEIYPMVLPCDSLIQFIPIIRSGNLTKATQSSPASSTHPSESDYYVIILTVRPQQSTLYRYRDDPEPIFVREGGVTNTLRGQQLDQRLLSSAKEVCELQQQVSQEKQSMLDMILVKKSQHF